MFSRIYQWSHTSLEFSLWVGLTTYSTSGYLFLLEWTLVSFKGSVHFIWHQIVRFINNKLLIILPFLIISWICSDGISFISVNGNLCFLYFFHLFRSLLILLFSESQLLVSLNFNVLLFSVWLIPTLIFITSFLVLTLCLISFYCLLR